MIIIVLIMLGFEFVLYIYGLFYVCNSGKVYDEINLLGLKINGLFFFNFLLIGKRFWKNFRYVVILDWGRMIFWNMNIVFYKLMNNRKYVMILMILL